LTKDKGQEIIVMTPNEFTRWQFESIDKTLKDMDELRNLFIVRFDRQFLKDCGIQIEEKS